MVVQIETLVGIGDAARMVGVATHTLRYWEKEFDFYLSPPRTQGRQRRYDEKSLEQLSHIKKMLKDDGYSIAGAKRILQKEISGEKVEEKSPMALRTEVLRRISSILETEMSDSYYATTY